MRRINISLTTLGSLQKAIDELNAYKQSLRDKAYIFIDRLLSIGIQTAESNSGEYQGWIFYYSNIIVAEYDCIGILIARDKGKIISEWYKGGQIVSAEVSPLLMAEFGSGWLAEVLYNVPNVGQGTFPGQTHAFDEGGWSWTTPDGVLHHSEGIKPTHPMHAAELALINNVVSVAREVFGNG